MIEQKNTISTNINNAKPFVKWAGGKTQLLPQISRKYPQELGLSIKKYSEPFVGGGAVLFDILSKYELDEVYISDINLELINAYIVIRDSVNDLIEILCVLENKYKLKDAENKKIFFYECRDEFNELIPKKIKSLSIEKAALFIFLNRTCFNGLYRVNRKGFFNVPIGSYKNPLICDSENLRQVSLALRNVEIKSGNYSDSLDFIDKNTFVYIDPPYRPISKTSNFTSYSKNEFDDQSQIELSNFAKIVDKKGAHIMLSNSDPKNIDENDNFFEEIYNNFNIFRIEANRMINSKANNRGKITELLITNY